MNKKMDLAGVRIDDYSVREAMRKIEIFLNNECMNTVETITMKTIVAAGKDESVRECLEKMDLVMAADKEILELAGKDPGDRGKGILLRVYEKGLEKSSEFFSPFSDRRGDGGTCGVSQPAVRRQDSDLRTVCL